MELFGYNKRLKKWLGKKKKLEGDIMRNNEKREENLDKKSLDKDKVINEGRRIVVNINVEKEKENLIEKRKLRKIDVMKIMKEKEISEK